MKATLYLMIIMSLLAGIGLIVMSVAFTLDLAPIFHGSGKLFWVMFGLFWCMVWFQKTIAWIAPPIQRLRELDAQRNGYTDGV